MLKKSSDIPIDIYVDVENGYKEKENIEFNDEDKNDDDDDDDEVFMAKVAAIGGTETF